MRTHTRNYHKLCKLLAVFSIVMLMSATSLLFQENVYIDEENSNYLHSYDQQIDTSDITDENSITGRGSPLAADENAWAENNSQQIGPMDAGSPDRGYINVPPQWTSYDLFVNITDLYDNSSWVKNGGINKSDEWTYTETQKAENNGNNGTDRREDCWGYYAGPSVLTEDGITGTESGALFVHQGYWDDDGSYDGMDNTHHASWDQDLYINRTGITDVQLSFQYWANYSGHGFTYLYGDINGYRKVLYVLEDQANNPYQEWASISVKIPEEEVSNYLTGQETINIQLGVQCAVDNLLVTQKDGYAYGESYFDNISLWIRGEAAPNQVELKMNDTSFNSGGIGLGNVSSTTVFENPSSQDFRPMVGEFSTNSSSVEFIADFSVSANRTKLTQDSNADPYTEFSAINGTTINWTANYYAIEPEGYENYNISIGFPSDWDARKAYNPEGTEILSDLDEGSDYLDINNTFAAASDGIWEIEYESPNYLTDLQIYKNGSTGPNDWLEADVLYPGDYLNITATVDNGGLVPNLIDTRGTLSIRLPDGNIWEEEISYKNVSSNTDPRIFFDPIQLPISGPSYQVGDFNVIVSWNNSINQVDFNEFGIYTGSFSVNHYSKLIPEQDTFLDFVEGDTESIRIDFKDKESNAAIQGALLYFDNLTGQRQYMSPISPGKYYAEITAPNINPGINTITVYANSTQYQNITIDLTFDVIIKSDLDSEDYPVVSALWSDNATISLNYTELTSENGITGASISTDWLLDSHVTEELNGIYSLELNTSSLAPGTSEQIEITTSRSGFLSSSIIMEIEIDIRPSDFQLFLEQDDKTLEKAYTQDIQETINITLDYFDTANSSWIPNANVTLAGLPGEDVTLTEEDSMYNYTLDTSDLGVGKHSLTLSAEGTFSEKIQIIIKITVQKRDSDWLLYLEDDDKTVEREIQITARELLNISLRYTELGETSSITGASVVVQGLPGGDLPLGLLNNFYQTNYDTDNLDVGTHTLSIVATSSDYRQQTVSFDVVVVARSTDYQLFIEGDDKTAVRSGEAVYNTDINISIGYYDTTSTPTLVSGATVNIQHALLGTESFTLSNNLYQYSLDTSDLAIGTHTLLITASVSDFESQSLLITFKVTNRTTTFELWLNEENKTLTKSVNAPKETAVNVSFFYFDELLENHLDFATVSLTGAGLDGVGMTLENGFFQYSLDTSDLAIGNHQVTATARANNYTVKTIQFTLSVARRPTSLNLYLDGEDKTSLRQVSASIRTYVNISIGYIDTLTSTNVNMGTARLIGADDSPISMIYENGNYQIQLNTSLLGLGKHYLTVQVSTPAHVQKSLLFTVQVVKRPTEISTPSDQATFDHELGKTFTLRIQINDTISGQLIKGAEVSYSATFGTGSLLDPDNDGVYIILLSDLPVGSQSIEISVYKGNEYEFESFTVTVNVIDTAEGTSPATIYGFSILIIGLLVAIAAYQFHFKYPKVIRKVRKARKTIDKPEDIDVKVRSQHEVYSDEYSDVLKTALPAEIMAEIKKTEGRDVSEVEEKEVVVSPEEVTKPEVAEEEEKPGKIAEKRDLKEKAVKKAKKEDTIKKGKEMEVAETAASKEKPETKPKEEKPPKQTKPTLMDDLKKVEAETSTTKVRAPQKKDFKKFKVPSVKTLPTKTKKDKAKAKDQKKDKKSETEKKKKDEAKD